MIFYYKSNCCHLGILKGFVRHINNILFPWVSAIQKNSSSLANWLTKRKPVDQNSADQTLWPKWTLVCFDSWTLCCWGGHLSLKKALVILWKPLICNKSFRNEETDACFLVDTYLFKTEFNGVKGQWLWSCMLGWEKQHLCSMNVCMHSFIQNTISNYFMTRFNLYSPTIKTERFEFMAGH